MSDTKKLSKIKTGVFSRSLSLAKLGVNAGLKYASTKITNSSMDDFINGQAVQLVKELGKLKGSAMKAGQLLSVYGEHFLTPEANKILKALQSDSISVTWPVIYNQLLQQFDAETLDRLEINHEPIGSASMGQVYLAVEKSTQKKIALKVQYPGVDKAIDSDVAALKSILTISKILPAELDTTGVFNEIKKMLHQELDYNYEAEQTVYYAGLINQDPRYKVPNVYTDYSASKILATEYMEGLRPDHPLVQNLSQERRNRLAENFLDLYFKELFQWNFLQTDPHLGNYKIQLGSDGKDTLVLLDFGAIKKFDSEFITSYRKMLKGSITKNEDLFFEGARLLGFVADSDSEEYVEKFKNLCYQVVEPFALDRNTIFDWKQNDLPKRVIKNAFEFRHFDLRTPPQELIFLDRKTAGVFMFMSALGAKFNPNKIIAPYLDSV